MTVQHVLKWCREFDNGQLNVMDEQRVVSCPRLLTLLRILMQQYKQTNLRVLLNLK
jgi:hypothetical protein